MADTVSSLYKYCSLDTGLKILNSQTLRWSAPHLFGDPFELNHTSDPQITSQGLLDVLLREALIMLFGPEAPTGRNNRLVNVMARWREQQKFIDEEQAHDVLQDLLGQIAKIQVDHVRTYMEEWRRYATVVRVASFSEAVDSLSCWERFAENHQGIALRFDCGAGTSLPQPQRVTYAAQAAVITHKQEQLEVIYGRRPAPVAEEFHTKLLVKGRHHAGELEWRCFDQGNEEDATSDPSLWYDNWRFPAHELRAVYCGVNVTDAQREPIARVLRASYPQARLYQAQPIAGRHELAFSLVEKTLLGKS